MQLKITHTLTKQNRILKKKSPNVLRQIHNLWDSYRKLAKENVLSFFLRFVQLDHIFKNKCSRVTNSHCAFVFVVTCMNNLRNSRKTQI